MSSGWISSAKAANRKPLHGRRQLPVLDIHQPGGLSKTNFPKKPPERKNREAAKPAEAELNQSPELPGGTLENMTPELAVSGSGEALASGDQVM